MVSAPLLWTLAGFGYLLTLVLVPLRCVARLRVVRRLALEDYLMIVAELCLTFEVIDSIITVYYGAGRHESSTPPDKYRLGLLWYWLAMVVYPWVMLFAKLSISLLLLRLMAARWQRLIIYATMAVAILISLILAFHTIFLCNPQPAFWDKQWSNCRLDQQAPVLYAHNTANVLTDFTLAVLPMIVLARTQLPRKQKIATAGVLVIGTGAGLASMVRFVFVPGVETGHDFLHNAVWIGLTSLLETCLAISAGCLATFRPFFVKVKRQGRHSDDTIGAAGQIGFHGTADTVRGRWDPGLTINFGLNASDEHVDESDHAHDQRSISMLSRSNSDLSLPMQNTDKDLFKEKDGLH